MKTDKRHLWARANIPAYYTNKEGLNAVLKRNAIKDPNDPAERLFYVYDKSMKKYIIPADQFSYGLDNPIERASTDLDFAAAVETLVRAGLDEDHAVVWMHKHADHPDADGEARTLGREVITRGVSRSLKDWMAEQIRQYHR